MAEEPPSGLPELLAPAGSMDSLRAAVSCGADAVYLGGKRFSARQYAGNFDDRELDEAVGFAHERGVRVYVAVNTLVHDREIPDAARYLGFLWSMGVDAVLIQDPGLAAIAREAVPGLTLHASTQMTIHNRAGLEWAAGMGMKRAVLARELSLGEVEAMGRLARRLGIDLEVFVHGALCYSYSGQCLLSSAIGGRSGNRGRCAQPCRRPYTLVSGRADPYGRPVRPAPLPLGDRYLLSTRDLALYPHLSRVARAPVAALKIEGRMRSPEYVATVTRVYRRALDAIAAGPWSPSPADEEALALTFNRGFTGGCLCGGRDDLMGRDAPGHRGVPAGVVVSVDGRTGEVAIRLTGSPMPEKGDGIAFRMRGEEDRGAGMTLALAKIDGGILWTRAPGGAGIREGAQVFITRRASLARMTGCSDPALSRILVDLALRAGETGRPVLEASVYRGGRQVAVLRREARFAIEQARGRELPGSEVREILSRRGEAPYRIGNVNVEWPAGSYAKKGDIGQLRRDILADTGAYLVREGRPAPGDAAAVGQQLDMVTGAVTGNGGAAGRRKVTQSVFLLTDSREGLDEIVGEGSGYLAFEPVSPGSRACDPLVDAVREAAEIVKGTGWTFAWKWPRITPDPWLSAAVGALGSGGPGDLPGAMVDGAGAALALRSAAPGIPIHGGAGLNAWNAGTVRGLGPLFRSLTLSPELSSGDLADLVSRVSGLPDLPLLGFPVQGNLEVMVSEDRLHGLFPEKRMRKGGAEFTGLRDGTGRIFPVGVDVCGRTRIANAVETCLIDQLPVLMSLGIGLLQIDARGRGHRYAMEMAALYNEGISLVQRGGEGSARELEGLREECRERSRGGITRGPFLKGLREDEEEPGTA
ncbi:MAG TPA: DUF3656 domain-containing protein [Methanomicrobiales archaeon]|nr:DUF3656 domain-containing protein [Methanomicrobiales archaeon]